MIGKMCCDCKIACLLLVAVCGVTWAASADGISAGGSGVGLNETRVNMKPIGRPKIVRGLYGKLGTNGTDLPPNNLWRIVCPQNHSLAPFTVVTVVMEMNLQSGVYLQMKTIQLGGSVMETPWAHHYKKKSILVGLVAHNISSESTFDLRYVCIGGSSNVLANAIFLNEDILQYMKSHDSAFEKAARLITHPEEIFELSRCPDIQAIFDMVPMQYTFNPNSVLGRNADTN